MGFILYMLAMGSLFGQLIIPWVGWGCFALFTYLLFNDD